MRYRGFNIVFTYADHISKFDPSNRVWGQAPGYYCEVFSEADDSLCNPLDNFELILGDRLQTLDEDEVEDWITKIADKEIDEWRCNEAVTLPSEKMIWSVALSLSSARANKVQCSMIHFMNRSG